MARSTLMSYFNVEDVKEIRNSKRFKEEVEPCFKGDIILSFDRSFLICVGHWARDERKNPGIYYLQTEGPATGHWVVARMTF